VAKRSIIFSLFVLVAELMASWWLWRGAPTDTLRVSYPGFWRYEVGRLLCWSVLSLLCAVIWLIVSLGMHGGARKEVKVALLVGLLLACALEVSTSMLYWNSRSSLPVRDLYGSVWYWHRVPQSSDQGWPSLKGYLWDPALAWAVLILIPQALWCLAGRKGKGEMRS
jgi:hypothetical protein